MIIFLEKFSSYTKNYIPIKSLHIQFNLYIYTLTEEKFSKRNDPSFLISPFAFELKAIDSKWKFHTRSMCLPLNDQPLSAP